MATICKLSVSVLLLASMWMSLSTANSNSVRGYAPIRGPMHGPNPGPFHGPFPGPFHGPRPSGQESCLRQEAQEAWNKQLVLNYTQELFGDKDLSAIDRYVAPDYIQHNPMVADGREAIKTVAAGWLAADPSHKTVDVRHVSAEGNLVWIHYKDIVGDAIMATVDLYRIENGKIQEHWDVFQVVDPTTSANPHPLF